MSPKAAYSDSFLSAQYLLHQTDYPEFLKYDSFVDCGMLFSIPLKKLMEGEYFGTLTSQDLQGIFEVLKTTETLTNKEKKRFGIIEEVSSILEHTASDGYLPRGNPVKSRKNNIPHSSDDKCRAILQ